MCSKKNETYRACAIIAPHRSHYCAAQSRFVTVAPRKGTIENLLASYPYSTCSQTHAKLIAVFHDLSLLVGSNYFLYASLAKVVFSHASEE